MFDYLEFFHSLIRFGSRPGLAGISALMARLGNPEAGLRIVHVAGTNGKGSTCTFLSEILQSAGCRTGLYISPYVVDFRERIQIDGQMIDEQTLSQAAELVKGAVEGLNRDGVIITEFEAVTAAAFLCFAARECDVVVLETGLGGRFDATNVIASTLVSVITSISLDHTQVLGNTLTSIAGEKSGIIKAGRPVVTNDAQSAEALSVISHTAAGHGSALTVAAVKGVAAREADIFGSEVLYRDEPLYIPLPGVHQVENALTAAAAAEVLRAQGLLIADADIRAGIGKARIPARTQVLCREPLILLDGSHNEGSTRALAELLRLHLPGKRLLGLMGMMGDKDCETALANLAPLFAAMITTTPSNARALPAQALADTARRFCIDVQAVDAPAQAYAMAKAMLGDYDGLIICGSLYFAADILALHQT